MKNERIVEWKHVGRDIENTCERCGEFEGQEMDILVAVRIDTAFGVI